jgi:hypothetical protein
MDIYRGQRCPVQFFATYLQGGGWRSIRFFGICIGRFYFGVQAFSKSEVIR